MTRISTIPGKFRLPLLFAALATVGIVAAGCSQGSYPLDIFYEMHYQPAYKAHEPPRLSVPESAVPWYGSTPPEPTLLDARTGRHIFEANCVMCHGAEGLGNGPVLARMIVDYGYQPLDLATQNPNLTSEAARSLDRDGLRGVIEGGVNVMPPFRKLLTPNQIELVLDYVEGCIQDGNAAACQ
ncbi:MAG: cytochrome c [Chloroflexota bacterium]|nr:cytochrome c [Chloroflexota bacterium]MDE2960094.1 cytochrome c [Chloroflexota bacterium]